MGRIRMQSGLSAAVVPNKITPPVRRNGGKKAKKKSANSTIINSKIPRVHKILGEIK